MPKGWLLANKATAMLSKPKPVEKAALSAYSLGRPNMTSRPPSPASAPRRP